MNQKKKIDERWKHLPVFESPRLFEKAQKRKAVEIAEIILDHEEEIEMPLGATFKEVTTNETTRRYSQGNLLYVAGVCDTGELIVGPKVFKPSNRIYPIYTLHSERVLDYNVIKRL